MITDDPATNRLRILHLEDDPADAALVRHTLAADDANADVVCVSSRAAFEAALQNGGFDLILSDYSLPDFDGPAALGLAGKLCPQVPFIIVSGALDEDTMIGLVRGGATDYVLKSRLRRLAPAIHQAMREARERQARHLAERQLRSRAQQQAVIAELGLLALGGLPVDTLMDEVARRVAATLDAGFSQVLALQPDGASLRLVAGVGWPAGHVGEVTVAATPTSLAGLTLASPSPILFADLATERRFDAAHLAREHGIRAGLTVSVPGRAGPYGVLGAYTDQSRLFTDDDAYFLQAAANLLAEAIARRQADALINLQVERLALLAEASQTFAEAGPDYAAVLNAVTRRVADLIGDACTLRLLSDDEQWLPVAADWHRNPAALAFLRGLAAQPLRVDGRGIASQVLRSGHSRLIPELSGASARELLSEAWWAYWERYGAHSLVAVPMWSRGRVIGVMIATRDESPAPYTLEDQHLLRGLADRAALAIENARLYEAAQQAWGAAELAAERTARLQSITALLAGALTPDQVGAIIVKEGAAALASGAAHLQLLSADGKSLEVVNVSGIYPSVEPPRRELPLDAAMPSADVMRTGQAVWMASDAEVLARYPRMAELRLIKGYEALAVLPLTVENRPIGTLAIGFARVRTFSPEERAFMLTLAGLCGQALERARLFAAEAAARAAAERSAERTGRLQMVTEALAQAVTPEQVIAVTVEHGVAALGASAGSIALQSAGGDAVDVILASGYSPAALAQFGRMPLEAPVPVTEVVRTGKAVWIESAEALAERYPLVAATHAELGHGAGVCVPVKLAGRTAGALSLSFVGSRSFDAQEKALILALTQQAAQALERARLFTEAQRLNLALEARVRERTEQLRALTARLESLREDERGRIAREVHDELGGAMTAIKMDLSRMARRAGHVDSSLPEALAATSSLIDSTIQTVRRIATDLRPALLDDFGLVAALEWQAQEFTRHTGIKCELDLEVQEVALDQQAAIAMFRVFQETLTNVARHAAASRVVVTLARRPGGLVLALHDDGKGFKVAELDRSPSLGLAGMRERVFAIAGELDIQSAPGEGTTVTVTIPFESGGGRQAPAP